MQIEKSCLILDDDTYIKADFTTLPSAQFSTAFKCDLSTVRIINWN